MVSTRSASLPCTTPCAKTPRCQPCPSPSSLAPPPILTTPLATNNEIKGEVHHPISQRLHLLLWNLEMTSPPPSSTLMHEYNINRPITVTLYAYHNNDGLFLYRQYIKRNRTEWIKTFYALCSGPRSWR